MRVRMRWFDQQGGRSPRLRSPLSLRPLSLWAGGLLVLGLALWGCSKKTITAPDANSPMITSLTATPIMVGRGESSLLYCSAQDPDGDSLSYAWSTTTGTFLSVGGDSAVQGYARWKAPDSAANATVTVTASDNRGKNAQKLVAITVTVYRLVASWGSQGSGAGQFLNPVGIAVGPNGDVYVADAGNNRIQKFNANGTFLRQWIRGDGDNDTTHHDLKNPRGVAADRLGYVYVVDTGNRQVQKFYDDGTNIQWRSTYDKTTNRFGTINGAAVTGNLDLYVSGYDTLGYGWVWLFLPNDTTYLARWSVDPPGGVAVDNSGWVYFPGTMTNYIYYINGNNQGAFSPTDTLYQFKGPYGVAVDDSANLFITDSGKHRVQKWHRNTDLTHSYRTRFGSLGTAPNQFNGPMGIALGADYSVYVVDAGNYQVKKFSAK